MMNHDLYDVVIVGAGPVGSTAANIAARHGLRCLLIDETRGVFPLPRAIHFDADVMRIFQFAELSDLIEPLTRATTGGVHLGMDGAPIRQFRVVDRPGELGWRPHYMFFQPELDALLRDTAMHRPNVDVSFGSHCYEVTDAGDEVLVSLRDETGAKTQVRGRYAIAADGSASSIRTQLGLTLTDYGFDEPWVVVDTVVEDDAAGPDYTIMYCDPARPATYVPGPGAHRRWEFMLLPGETGTELTTDSGIRELIGSVTPWLGSTTLTIGRTAVYRFHALVASHWRSGRVFLAGDAAHQTPPFMGQGMCHGIRDVRNLLWKVAAVLNAGYPERLLDTYQAEREPHVRAIIEAAVANGRYIGTLDPAVAAARDIELRTRMNQGTDVRSFREVIPGLQTGLLDPQDQSSAAGLLFVQPRVMVEGTAPQALDELLDDRFVLLSMADVPGGDDVDWFQNDIRGRVYELESAFEDTEGTLREWFAAFDGAAVLIRPDRYVFGVARTVAEIPALLGRLRDVIGHEQVVVAEGTR
jgi:3-(3-hydroxy-phenyl)propionate hydroxylase